MGLLLARRRSALHVPQVREVAEMYLPRAVDLSEAQEMTLLDGELVKVSLGFNVLGFWV